MRYEVVVDGVAIEVLASWHRMVADDLPNDAPPTLARPDGVGVIQFSAARYLSGTKPEIDGPTLRAMLETFVVASNLSGAEMMEARRTSRGHQVVEARYDGNGERIHVWIVSNGSNSALVTYVTQRSPDSLVEAEIQDALAIVDRLRFE